MSQNLIFAPCRTNASAVVVNVNDGTITVSPGWRSSIRAVSSRADVHEVVSSTSWALNSASRISSARLTNSPPDDVCPRSSACWM